MDFYQGGLFAYDRDEGCFVKYMTDTIQSAQFYLKNEQWYINVDFEEFISSIRCFGFVLKRRIFLLLARFLLICWQVLVNSGSNRKNWQGWLQISF